MKTVDVPLQHPRETFVESALNKNTLCILLSRRTPHTCTLNKLRLTWNPINVSTTYQCDAEIVSKILTITIGRGCAASILILSPSSPRLPSEAWVPFGSNLCGRDGSTITVPSIATRRLSEKSTRLISIARSLSSSFLSFGHCPNQSFTSRFRRCMER